MSSVAYTEREEKKNSIVSLMRQKDWKSVLQKFDSDDQYREPLLVWIRPSHHLLNFIESQLQALHISKVAKKLLVCPLL